VTWRRALPPDFEIATNPGKKKNGQILNLAVPCAAFQSLEDVLTRSNRTSRDLENRVLPLWFVFRR
jgi:hypothetical protein